MPTSHLGYDYFRATNQLEFQEPGQFSYQTPEEMVWTGKVCNNNPSWLPKSKGGLQLPSISTTYKKIRCAIAASNMTSKDPTVRFLASRQTQAEATAKRAAFKPHQQVVEVMQEDPGVSRKELIKRCKEKIAAVDTTARIERCTSLQLRGQTVHLFQEKEAEQWSNTITTLPQHIFKFALNSITNTLPHNANLHMWKKTPSPKCKLCSERQTLAHVLNSCEVALKNRRYNSRHDAILQCIFLFVKKHLQPNSNITVDLPAHNYQFPQHVALTDTRPDLVIWNDRERTAAIVELTVPFETGFEEAISRKTNRYSGLLDESRKNGFDTKLITIEIGARGFINMPGLAKLYLQTTANRKEKNELERIIIRTCIEESYKIWCMRNWQSSYPEGP